MSKTPTPIAIAGAAGRMGRRLIALAAERSDLQLLAAIEHGASEHLGADAGSLAGIAPLNLPISDSLPEAFPAGGIIIDFTTPASTRELLDLARFRQTPLVIGTTGLSDEDQTAIDELSHHLPALQAANFSLVVNVLIHLSARASTLLGEPYDCEIVEAHHRFKKDAPSGTALAIANAICQARGVDPKETLKFERVGDDPRQPGEITLQTLRLGDVVGEHTVYFGTIGERLALQHIGGSRDSYAAGALSAARWLDGRQPGRYTMNDVLGLES